MNSNTARTSPIGVFDSGVGGLSILREIRKILPAENLVYLADTAHCPYGIKPVEEIRERTLQVTDFLVSLAVKAVVVACNSACEAGLNRIRDKYPKLPVVGVEPAVKPAHQETHNGIIGVLATELTINGERLSHLIAKYGDGIKILTQPAPRLVELVEDGELESMKAESILHQYLDPLLDQGIDTLVLGCTHYPFLRPMIEKICGPKVTVLDTGLAIARQTSKLLAESELSNSSTTVGQDIFYTSGDPDLVASTIAKLWFYKPAQVLKFEE